MSISVSSVMAGADDPLALSGLSKSLQKNVEESVNLLGAWEELGFDLYDALDQTYQNNPSLLSKRAEFMAIKERLPQARSGLKPTINAEAGVNYTNLETEGQNFGNSDGGNTAKNFGITVSQPLFKGGSTYANIKAANAVIAAQAASLRSSEQTILLQAVTAYMDVMRNKATLQLTKNNMDLIARELEQSIVRFDVGEVTQTDVSQARARHALAQAQLTQAEGNLNSAIAVYEEVVGHKPDLDKLSLPETIFELPETKDEAMRLAELQNFSVILAENTEIAAQYDVDSTFGELLPQISATGSLGRNYDPSDFIEEQDQIALGVTASIPLYQSGATRSRLRQAKQVANQRFLEVVDIKNQVRSEAASNYASWQTAKAEIESRKAQVDASTLAREGVHYEAELGERTTLDTLDANLELLNAQLDLITAQRNEVVARFSLAQTLGLLTPQGLDLNEDR
ncbi:MAG: TolC family outer membrane protein [Alphaproteobacteria bacterium]|nr:TolC family outer membrane protein [Alphaproteobacteria bacterium]